MEYGVKKQREIILLKEAGLVLRLMAQCVVALEIQGARNHLELLP